MASSVTTQTTPGAGVTEIIAQMVSAGWTNEATANPYTASSTNYYVLKSPSGSNAIGVDYWVMIYNPNATNFIVCQLFEAFVGGGTPTKQFWAPSTGGTPNGSFQFTAAAQSIDTQTGSIATGALDCGSGSYTLVVKATIDYVCCASQNNVPTRRNFYAGTYIPFSWNTETVPLVLTCSFNRTVFNTSNPSSFPPDASGTSYQGTGSGSALTRERWTGAWQVFSGATQNNFTGSWMPLKSLVTGTSLPPSNTRDGLSLSNTPALPIYLMKSSPSQGVPFREVWLGTYRHMYDIGGIGGGNVADTVTISAATYYLIANTTGVAGDIYIAA